MSCDFGTSAGPIDLSRLLSSLSLRLGCTLLSTLALNDLLEREMVVLLKPSERVLYMVFLKVALLCTSVHKYNFKLMKEHGINTYMI